MLRLEPAHLREGVYGETNTRLLLPLGEGLSPAARQFLHALEGTDQPRAAAAARARA